MTEISEKTIDIDQILDGKMGSKARYVPSFVRKWLKHIVHQDEVNKFLWESRDKKGVEWLEECVRYLDMNLQVEGKENLPDKDDGKLYTFVSNHPLGGEDGVALGAEAPGDRAPAPVGRDAPQERIEQFRQAALVPGAHGQGHDAEVLCISGKELLKACSALSVGLVEHCQEGDPP